MGSDLNWSRIGDMIERVIDNRGRTPPTEKSPTPFELIEVNALKGSQKRPSYSAVNKYITQETFETWFRNGHPKKNDVLFSTVGSIAEVAVSEGRGCIAQNVVALRPNVAKLDGNYLYYILSNPATKNQLRSLDISSVQPSIKVPHLLAFELPWLSLRDQKAIAHILGTLDDKIELNRQMNATLESMAQALFKSWFVDFDPVIDNALEAGNPIPDSLQARAERRKALGDQRKPLPDEVQQHFPSSFVFNEELGWAPEGWEVTPLDAMIELIGGGTPKTSVDEYWNGDIPWFSVVDAPNESDVFVLDTEKHITPQGIQNSSAKLLPVGTTIISARGTVGKCAVIGKPMAMNQSCYGVRGIEGYGDYFTYYMVLLRVADLQQRSHGSVFSTITRDTFRSIKTAKSSSVLSMAFDDSVSNYMSRIVVNIQSSQTLAKLRDTLLPKLLSGQLHIPDAEKQLTEAI